MIKSDSKKGYEVKRNTPFYYRGARLAEAQKSILLRKRRKLRRPKAFRLSTLILLLKPSV